MPYTWATLKSEVRSQLFPEGEASNLVTAHDKFFLDAIMDIQRWCECAQQDNTDIVPQCSTFYRCGITVLDKPRGAIKSVSVIDKINPSTLLEDPTQPDDFCTEIFYSQISHCHVDCYWQASKRMGCCLPIGLFFGFPCHKANFPVPTDAGLPPGLPVLPLGYHYPQTSTDRTHGRANGGRWAIERDQIYIIPWLQSTESVVIKWDGIKRIWNDGDPVDQDPDLSRAILEYVRWQDADKFGHDESQAAAAAQQYADALAKLIHECREETRIRGCEPSLARFSSQTITNLYYNDSPQSATVNCPAGQTGNPVTVTIPSGTVSSTVSVADANAKALTQAQSQAQAQLVCTTPPPTFTNTVAGNFTAICTSDDQHPPPTGTPVTVNIPIGTVTSTVSVQDANDQAQVQAQAQAEAQLKCIYWNKATTVTLTCPNNPAITGTGTVAAKTYSSSDQSLADQLATNAATLLAQTDLTNKGCTAGSFFNTQQQATATNHCAFGGKPCTVTLTVIVPAGTFSASDQNTANQYAINTAANYAAMWGQQMCQLGLCGTFTAHYPTRPF